MKLALDPFMLRSTALAELPGVFKAGRDAAGVQVRSALPLYRGPDRTRTTAMPPSGTGSTRSRSQSSPPGPRRS